MLYVVLWLFISSLKSSFQHTGLNMSLTEVTVKHAEISYILLEWEEPVMVNYPTHFYRWLV